MSLLRDRLITDTSEPGIRSTGISISEVDDRLCAGEPAAAVAASIAITPPDLIAAVAWSALGPDGSPGPTLKQTRPRFPKLERTLSEPSLAALFPRAGHLTRLALAAGLLQIYDFWDLSHNAAQRADDLGEKDFSAYWHGIAHRREPDAANAAYWFRRVRAHPVQGLLAREAHPLLTQYGDRTLESRLMPGGAWNSSAMIDLCTRAGPGTPNEAILRQLQRLEMWLLLEATFAAV